MSLALILQLHFKFESWEEKQLESLQRNSLLGTRTGFGPLRLAFLQGRPLRLAFLQGRCRPGSDSAPRLCYRLCNSRRAHLNAKVGADSWLLLRPLLFEFLLLSPNSLETSFLLTAGPKRCRRTSRPQSHGHSVSWGFLEKTDSGTGLRKGGL